MSYTENKTSNPGTNKESNQTSDWIFEKENIACNSLQKIKFGIKIKKKLFESHSSYQKIELIDTYDFGKVLILDGIFQTSERDEFIYHEMLSHLPLFYHNKPKNVLIIGGGDGGILEEVLKHPIEKVCMVEIDEKVIDISKKFLPSISNNAFDDEKAEIIIGDGKKYIKNTNDFFDVIILDLSDPCGPAEDLISLDFYKDVKKILNDDGIIAIQSGCLITQHKMVKTINDRISHLFPNVKLHRAAIPIFQFGEYSFTMATKNDLTQTTVDLLKEKQSLLNLDLQYWSPEIHIASAILPKYLNLKLEEIKS